MLKQQIMFYPIALTIGFTLLLASLLTLKESLAFIRTGERANAVVTELREEKSDDGPTYRPIFTFTTKTGQRVTYSHTMTSSPAGWYVGEPAVVVYDPANTERVKLLTYFGAFLWTIILMALAMPFLVIGGGYYLSRHLLEQSF